jgi:hypothetical protein
MHPVVTNHPAYREITDRRDELDRARRDVIQQGEEWDAASKERQRILAAHLASGAPAPDLPPLPERPDTATALLRIHAEAQAVREAETAWLREHEEELFDTLRDEEAKLAKRAAVHVAKLRELTDAWSDIAYAVQCIRGHGDARRPTVTTAEVAAGVSVIPEPRTRPVPPVTPAPRGHDEAGSREHRDRLRIARERALSRTRTRR